ncbi:MAG: hypothetical protein K1X88_33220 [Nannocystaceae bacterium]|nr:hypothetical protein [Nannocystaceae bacterium]
MTVAMPLRPRLRDELRIVETASEGVGDVRDDAPVQLLDPATGRRMHLSAAQRQAFALFDGTRDVLALAHGLAAQDIEADVDDVAALVRDAAALDLLAESDPARDGERVAARRARRRRALDQALDHALAQVLRLACTIPAFAAAVRAAEIDEPRQWLAAVPSFDKAGLRASFPDRLLPDGRDAEALYVRRSSGTASEGVQSFREPDEDAQQDDRLWTMAAFVGGAMGVRFTTRQCTGGACPLPSLDAGGPRHRVHEGTLWLDLRDDAWSLQAWELDAIDDAIRGAAPTHFGADAAYLARWVHHVRARGRTLPRVRHVQTGFADTCAIHRGVLRRAFGCPVIDVLSSSELGLVAVECSAGHHHVLEPLLLAEVLTPTRPGTARDDRPVAPGELGELVLTTVARREAPLLRYRTGDLVRALPGPCPCGAAEQALQLEGRARDVLWLAQGPVTSRAIDRAIGDDQALLHYQLQQREPDRFELRAIGNAEGAAARLSALLGAPVRARSVTRIAAEASGKYAYVRPLT